MTSSTDAVASTRTHQLDSVPRFRRVSKSVTIAVVVLGGFAGLGAAVATPLFGLVCGLMTLGLVGLGWVMV